MPALRFCRRIIHVAVLAASLLFLGAGAGVAQTFEVVHAFALLPERPAGKLLQIADGAFLGLSSRGGTSDAGTIYAVYRKPDSTWGTVVLHSFDGANGATPVDALMRASDGNFYGATQFGGASGLGTIFRLTPWLQFSTMHSFSGPDGDQPNGSLVQGADGALWGTTRLGGSPTPGVGDRGTVFRMTVSGAFTRIHTFTGAADSVPETGLIAGSDGHLYGTTSLGPATNDGTLFRVTTAGVLSTICEFPKLDFTGPRPIIEGADGHLYGTLDSERGYAFRVTKSGALTILHTFDGSDGFRTPSGGFAEPGDGWLYGTALSRFDPVANEAVLDGVVYRMSLAGAVEHVGDLGGALGALPLGLITASDGRVYGATTAAWLPLPSPTTAVAGGAVFSAAGSGPVTPLITFGPAPRRPNSRLVEGPDGALYGTAGGGLNGLGTIYRLDATGVTLLHSFNDGSLPAGLTLGPDGQLYGTTIRGGVPPPGMTSEGTVFRISLGGTYQLLKSFVGPVFPLVNWTQFPITPPALGSDGQMYFTTMDLSLRSGTVWRLSTDGSTTPLTGPTDFNTFPYPAGPPILASDGNLYGTSTGRADFGGGAIYRVTPGGLVSAIHIFPDVSYRSGLLQGSNGRFYGVSTTGSFPFLGQVFSSTVNGPATPLHTFIGIDGLFPIGELIETSAQKFMGVTHGSPNPAHAAFGTVYEVGADGSFRTVHRFSSNDGANPATGLTRTTSGVVYGVTTTGGPLGGGVIFRLVPSATTTATLRDQR